MDHKKPQVIAQRIPKLIRPNWVTEKGLKILQPHIQTRLIYFGKKCQPQSIEQRIDHYGSIDENCRGQKYPDMPSGFALFLKLWH
jgi:hypothetical protein